ncbi:hypothetical protein [Amycolatopsis sp. YIM 10]|uniref:HAAS signaling domain-containing protein n=1 Tax=Amycolatopsis sp. YIM 10 TaxID=2653857 RepID=UPI00128FEAFF|nr:hypothetical protein [Amycolatopsis sp. YIM 10]QFU92077.1 hypothetical protein YIM_34580 [Amycolatopsis sp. YIM 10]
MNAVTHKTAAKWLERFDRAAVALPQPRRDELRQELAEHLEAVIESGEDPDTAVERLGDPAEIVAAEGLPPVSPARARAARGLLLLPLTGLLYLTPALPPGPLNMLVILAASFTVLGLVLRAEASASTRTLGVLGALAPPLAGLGGILDKVFQAGGLMTQEPGRAYQYALGTDSWVIALGQLAMLLLGLGLPVLAGLRLRRQETPVDTRAFLGALALVLTPAAGLAAALLLSGSRLGTSVGTMVEVPLLITALACAAVLLAAGVMLLAHRGLSLLTKVLVAAAILTAPVGVALLAEHEVQPGGVSWDAGTPPTEVPRDVPDDRTLPLGLGLLLVIALPLAAADRVHRAEKDEVRNSR